MTIYNWFTRGKWWFSIVMLAYQRLYIYLSTVWTLFSWLLCGHSGIPQYHSHIIFNGHFRNRFIRGTYHIQALFHRPMQEDIPTKYGLKYSTFGSRSCLPLVNSKGYFHGTKALLEALRDNQELQTLELDRGRAGAVPHTGMQKILWLGHPQGVETIRKPATKCFYVVHIYIYIVYHIFTYIYIYMCACVWSQSLPYTCHIFRQLILEPRGNEALVCPFRNGA